MIRFSFANLLAPSSATVVGSSQQSLSFAAANVKAPQRPFLPWRTSGVGDQDVVVDFGSAKTVDVILLARTNFTTARIQGNASDSWGAPAFNQLVTITQNPMNLRYQYGAVLTAFSYRYLRILIPSQTPTDGASYYLLGGLWAGGQTRPPDTFLYQIKYDTGEPQIDLQPEHKGWRQRLILGEPYAKMTVRRKARVNFTQPFIDDQLRRWVLVDGQMRQADFFGFWPDRGDTSQAYVMRRITELGWDHNRQNLAEADLTLEEAIQ